jgi:hypothetical protein
VPRKLSSPFQTWVYRVSAIFGVVIGAIVFTRVAWPPSSFLYLPITIWSATIAYGLFNAFRFKDVELDGSDLIIKNFGQQIRVPLNTVASVKGGLGGKNPIRLEFRIATDFGETIRFLPPPRRSMWPWQLHPLVAELQKLCGLSNDAV